MTLRRRRFLALASAGAAPALAGCTPWGRPGPASGSTRARSAVRNGRRRPKPGRTCSWSWRATGQSPPSTTTRCSSTCRRPATNSPSPRGCGPPPVQAGWVSPEPVDRGGRPRGAGRRAGDGPGPAPRPGGRWDGDSTARGPAGVGVIHPRAAAGRDRDRRLGAIDETRRRLDRRTVPAPASGRGRWPVRRPGSVESGPERRV